MKGKAAFRVLLVYLFVIFLFLCGTYLGNKTVSVIAEIRPVFRKHRIVIDPGHGGEDGGAISVSGRSESQYNLEISQRLNDLLQAMGYQTVMTRKTDTSIYTEGSSVIARKASDLRERVRITNSYPDTVLLSIHQNYFSESKYSGAQIFYADNPPSRDFAHKLQTSLAASINKGSNRVEKRGEGIFLLEKSNCLAVLIECGFISNPQEDIKLSSEKYQKQLISVIASAAALNISDT